MGASLEGIVRVPLLPAPYGPSGHFPRCAGAELNTDTMGTDMKKLLAIAALAFAAACSPQPAKPAQAAITPETIAAESSKLTAFLDAEFEKEVQLSPERLTNLGRKDQYDKLDDYS